MHDYKQFALMLKPIEEKDLILFDMSPEDKTQVVRQYNRALMNAQRDGTDVAQIILKPLISKYPGWGDPALIFGLCLASEELFPRAESAVEYAVNNTLGSQQVLTIAQEAMKCIREDIKNPPAKPEAPRTNKNWTSMVAEDGKPQSRNGMQAPILTKASNRTNDFQMASDKERRDIMMRSASAGDEMPGDDIDIETVRTPADRLRLMTRIVAVIVGLTVVILLVYFGLIPLIAKIRNSSDTQKRLDYLIEQLDNHKDDPEVAKIIEEYAGEFSGDAGTTSAAASETAADTAAETPEETEAETAADTEAETAEETAADTEAETQSEGEAE